MRNISIPSPFNSYWAAFITLDCNFRCLYCIQKIHGSIPNYDLLPGKLWVDKLNSIEGRQKARFLQRTKVKKLAIIGGEPAIHPDFLEILNGLDNHWMIVVTSNLSAPIFSNFDLFLKQIKRKKRLKFNLSFHPSFAKIEDFISKVIALKRSGIRVHHVFYVAYPPDNEKQAKDIKKEFAKKGLNLQLQRYTGFYKGELYPKEKTAIEYEFEDGINNYKLYQEACSQKSKRKVLCKLNKVLFAPNGNIYNCHYRLYTNSPYCYGNLFDKEFIINLPQDFFECEEFGLCNPCDFGNFQIRTLS